MVGRVEVIRLPGLPPMLTLARAVEELLLADRRRSLRGRVVIDSFPRLISSRFAVSMGHKSEGTRQPDFFLKPVAGSAGRLAPPLHGVVSVQGGRLKWLYTR